MKESVWAYWIMVLGLSIMSVMTLLQSYTTTSEQDYYLIKNVMEASMYDAVDYGYYRKYGEVRIIKEKFVENFLRRFAESANLNTTYEVSFYDIYEAPPKVSVKVSSSSKVFNVFGDASSFDVVNKIDSILELNPDLGKEETE